MQKKFTAEGIAQLLFPKKSMILRLFGSSSIAETSHSMRPTSSGSGEENRRKQPKKGDFNGKMSFAIPSVGLILFLVSSVSLPALEISELDASIIAQKIWMNECNQTIEGLMTWNQGEGFASLGIGHFIWYPMGKTDKFVETFPSLVQFLKDHKVQLPHWLNPKTTCPWHTREEFEKNKRSGKMGELRNLLTQTITLQALFMAERFSSIEPALVKDLPKSDVDHIQAQIERLGKTPGGTYVLLDYLNFKGDGANPSERYEDKGWGLRQVLLKMPGNTDNPIEEFISGATKVLSDRVELSPPQRNEARWLPGWLNRLKTYRSKD